MIADSTGTTVWRNDNSEPFGDSVADENPSGLGTFEMPLRFLGQYSDNETGLAYNMARDYWASGGRYVESDLIGLKGGLNTYAYVNAGPLLYVDGSGLRVNWKGSIWGGGAVGSIFYFNFTSECKCNKVTEIHGYISTLGVSVGLKGPKAKPEASVSGGPLDMHSWDDCPSESDGNGPAGIVGINAIVGGGFSLFTKVRVGHLYSDFEVFSGPQYGWDASAGVALGEAFVTTSKEHCCSK